MMRSTRLKKTIVSLATAGLLLAMLIGAMATPAAAADAYYWKQIRAGSSSNLNALTATDADHVWEAGGNGTSTGYIASTSNATAATPTWKGYTSADIYLGGIFALDNTHVWAAGGNAGASAPNTSAILCWDGTKWDQQNNNGTTYQLNGAAALSPTQAWVCGVDSSKVGRILWSNGKAYNSGAGGYAWQDDFIDPTKGTAIKNLSAAGSSVWAVGYVKNTGNGYTANQGIIFKRTGTNAWKVQDTTAVGNKLYGIQALDDNHAWAVGYTGTILSTSDGGRPGPRRRGYPAPLTS